MNEIFKGIRPLDYVLAALMTAAGVLLMVENVAASGEDLPHPLSTTSWAMVPAFLLVTLPILWRRRNILAVVGITTVLTVAHVLAFGWITRCGVLIPLAFALAYAVGRFGGIWRNHVLGLAGIVVLNLVMLARDASIDTVVSALPVALPGVALFYGIGVLVQNRVSKQSVGNAPVDERLAA
ncbi:hypothetical protein EV138_0253 [Kribbella voronezhensis]|uniref:Uncharacterized protein n=1 Tax=Kribbella voronezhensis TaxID=2512212 RepID=A0A4R7T6M2_9ACTN|nr:hypothetical protein [Kribbella voronezhensis]TDU86738.1 hypothetical protein EV138_0253 [Kribbella voronezhensis]